MSPAKAEPQRLGFWREALVHPTLARCSIARSHHLNPALPHPKQVPSARIKPPLHVVSQNRAPVARFLAGSPSPPHPSAPLNCALPPLQPRVSPPRTGPLCRNKAPPHVVSQNRAPVARFLAGSPSPPHLRAPLNRPPPPPQPHVTPPQSGPLCTNKCPPACRQPKLSPSGLVFGREHTVSPRPTSITHPQVRTGCHGPKVPSVTETTMTMETTTTPSSSSFGRAPTTSIDLRDRLPPPRCYPPCVPISRHPPPPVPSPRPLPFPIPVCPQPFPSSLSHMILYHVTCKQFIVGYASTHCCTS